LQSRDKDKQVYFINQIIEEFFYLCRMKYPFVDIHTHARTGEGIEVVNHDLRSGGGFPIPPFSIGVHPWAVGQVDEAWLATALRKVETAPVSAIGEIGLDFAPSITSDHGEQKMVFAAQLRIAEERGLPVILHCVRAFEPTMEILAGFRLPAVIFHGFVGSPEQAAAAVRKGYYLSFDERSLGSPKTVEAMRGVPLDRLFLETDDAEIPIAVMYERAAAIFAVPVAQLKQTIFENYARLA
jgi:TatD DNase family protein